MQKTRNSNGQVCRWRNGVNKEGSYSFLNISGGGMITFSLSTGSDFFSWTTDPRGAVIVSTKLILNTRWVDQSIQIDRSLCWNEEFLSFRSFHKRVFHNSIFIFNFKSFWDSADSRIFLSNKFVQRWSQNEEAEAIKYLIFKLKTAKLVIESKSNEDLQKLSI